MVIALVMNAEPTTAHDVGGGDPSMNAKSHVSVANVVAVEGTRVHKLRC